MRYRPAAVAARLWARPSTKALADLLPSTSACSELRNTEQLGIVMAKRATNSKRSAVPIDVARFEAMAEEATVTLTVKRSRSADGRACSTITSLSRSRRRCSAKQ